MQETISKAIDQGGRLKVKSALNPALWLCGIVSIPILLAANFNPNISHLIVIVGITPVIIASFGYLFLLFFDRDKLQSEDYQIRKKSLEMIEQSDGLKIAKVEDLNAIANPRYDSGVSQYD